MRDALYSHNLKEDYRLTAERIFQKVQKMQSEAASLSTDEKEGMFELRQDLYDILEWQADDTPEHILNSHFTFVGAVVPPRLGSLKDFLLARRMKAEEEAASSATDMDMEGVVEGVAEAGTKADAERTEVPDEV